MTFIQILTESKIQTASQTALKGSGPLLTQQQKHSVIYCNQTKEQFTNVVPDL